MQVWDNGFPSPIRSGQCPQTYVEFSESYHDGRGIINEGNDGGEVYWELQDDAKSRFVIQARYNGGSDGDEGNIQVSHSLLCLA